MDKEIITPRDKVFLSMKVVQGAMDAHAKRMSIAFNTWLNENYLPIYRDNDRSVDLQWYIAKSYHHPGNWQLEELYNKFTEYISK